MKKIGFLGPKGTFSHAAADVYIKDKNNYNIVDFNTITDLILAVSNEEIDEAIVPIENSLEGAINVTLDMLATEVDLKIKEEVVLTVKQNLLAKKGTRFEDIKSILSHPQPIGQCRKYISTHFPNAEVRYVYSTSTAAEEVSKSQGGLAAIGSTIAAQVYDLNILDEEIHDGNNNLTRFVVISKEDSLKSGNDRTSIVFSTMDQPGSLYRILDIFNLWDINLTKIESRPAKDELGKYIFFVDIEGHKEDEDVRDALTMVQRKTSFYKFLGSYPVFKRKE